jgi:eukaryotic-like serine/threonine-protein kinase
MSIGSDDTLDGALVLAGGDCGDGSDAEPPGTDAHAPLLARGTVLGDQFEVRDLIGEGGMGQVYEAQDRWLNRRVAIKVGRTAQGTSVLAEAQALAALRHPSIVAIHSVGHHGGMEYVVMELIHGPSLDEHMIRQRKRAQLFPIHEAVELLVGVSEGLAAVHRAGIAHCDVKPSNILLAPGNRVVLTDFGIFQPEINTSKARDPAGSPSYMAPETISRTVRPGEAYLVDIYALGVMAYELLTGAPPFPDGNVNRVFWWHLTQEPPKPRERRPEVPPRLSDLVHEMLAKDPRTRPQSMEEVSWRLQHLFGAHPTPDGPFTAEPVSGVVNRIPGRAAG